MLILLLLNEKHIIVIVSKQIFCKIIEKYRYILFKHRRLFITFQYKNYILYYIYFILFVILQTYFNNKIQFTKSKEKIPRKHKKVF